MSGAADLGLVALEASARRMSAKLMKRARENAREDYLKKCS
jgi:hypothetical protein